MHRLLAKRTTARFPAEALLIRVVDLTEGTKGATAVRQHVFSSLLLSDAVWGEIMRSEEDSQAWRVLGSHSL